MRIKKPLFVSTSIISIAMAGMIAAPPAGAQDAPTAKQLMEMIQAQQKQLDALKVALENAETQTKEVAAKVETSSSAGGAILPNGINFGGVIELEATSAETFAGADTSDLTLAKVELFMDAQPTDYVSTHIQLLYEDDGTETISLDEAFVTLGNTKENPLYLVAGKWAMPFGGFDTGMSTGPLSKSLGETKEAAVLVGYTQSGFTLEGYGYNGDTQKSGEGNNIDQFGLAASYNAEMGNTAITLGGGYISNIADSDVLTTTLGGTSTALNKYVGGWEAHGSIGHGPFTAFAGYMSAAESFQSGEIAFNSLGAKPVAWNIEANYLVQLMHKETTFAATIQGTKEALALGLAETRIGGAVTVQVIDHVAVAVEYLHDEDYSASDGGTGKNADTGTLKLAVDF